MSGHPFADELQVDGADSSVERLAGLFDTHHDRLYRLARRLTNASVDASDLVQETFLKAAVSLTSVPQGSAGEEAWLVRVLINIQRDHWRKAECASAMN
jgi:RNA polymerase sigma-70 factor (ECF subfamily)